MIDSEKGLWKGVPARPALPLPLTGKGVQEYASGENVFDRG